MIGYTRIESPLGAMLATSDGRSLTGLYFVGQKYEPIRRASWRPAPDRTLFVEVREQLEGYFAGRLTRFEVPVETAGTQFQKKVWELLTSIPYGAMATYSDLARQLGRPEAARAVGTAVSRNPVSLIVPCHRVVGKNGALTGYAGGLDKKRALLDLEAGSSAAGGRFPV